jgi:hypothetical protein
MKNGFADQLSPGGFGARVTADVTVTGGTTLYAIVGGNGDNGPANDGYGGANGGANGTGFWSGGGGGASDIRTSESDLSTRLLVAAGGGGGGGNVGGEAGGNAGSAGSNGDDAIFNGQLDAGGGGGGGAGTDAAGGAGGQGGTGTGDYSGIPGCNGDDGSLGLGGTGGFQATSLCQSGGGGGGGGLFGGGGGGGGARGNVTGVDAFAGDGGGGGGVSLVPAGGSLSVDGTQPEIVISFTLPDTTAPTTTIALSPATGNGSNGWYDSAVGVSITAMDPDDPVAQTRCMLDPASVPASFDALPDASCSLSSVGSDGQHTIYAASKDSNGNKEAPVKVSFKVDQTPPSLAPTVSPSTISLGQTGVTASPNASDATSGIASENCGPVDTSTAGDHTITCTATDNAGNVATTTVHYTIQYQILGFFSPPKGSKWKLGRTVPIKTALGDGSGMQISDSEAAALAAACRVTFSASGAQNLGPACMKYDSTTHQFIYNWMLSKAGAGAETIAVTVSYPGTSTTTTKSESITITSS